MSVANVLVSPHAAEQIRLRKLTVAQVVDTVINPEQTTVAAYGRYFAERRIQKEGKIYLVRALIEGTDEELVVLVVTVYLTSKLGKYWRGTE